MTERIQRKKAPQWFRLFATDFQVQTGGMKAAEKGVYISLLCAMHERGEPIPEDHSRLARLSGTTPAAFKSALDALMKVGLIFHWDAGLLWSEMSESEAQNREKYSELQREKSSKRWKKTEQNQQNAHAGGYRDKSIRDKNIDAHSPTESEQSLISSQNDNQVLSDLGDEAARESAAPPSIQVNERVYISGLGECFVEKIVSNRPLIFLVYPRSPDGTLRACRVDRHLRWHEISLNEADALPDLSGEIHDQPA